MAIDTTSDALDTKTRLVEATIVELATKRPSNIRFNDVCAELRVPASLVQYYFGGRDGLITEAAVVSYERYVAQNLDATKSAKRDPESRLRAWITSQYEWTVANPGIASLLNFGMFIDMVDSEITAFQRERFEKAGRKNMAVLAQLVHDVRVGSVSDEILPTIGSDAADATLTALVAWTTLGFSTWAAGRHLPTRHLAGVVSEKNSVHAVIDELIARVRQG